MCPATDDSVFRFDALGQALQRGFGFLGQAGVCGAGSHLFQDLASFRRSDVFQCRNHALKAQTVAAWVERLRAVGVPAAPIHTMADVVKDPQLTARGMFVDVEDPEMGKLRMAGSAFKISGYPQSTTRPPAPNLDEARADVLAELGLPEEERRPRVRQDEKPHLW